jgi:uncharacterized membrane protein
VNLFNGAHETFQSILWRLGIVIGCHQQPRRSFSIKGRQVPICSRCFGLLIGSAMVPFYCTNLRAAAVFICAMLMDGGTQALGLRESTNSLRFITGMGFALACGGLVVRILVKLWNM